MNDCIICGKSLVELTYLPYGLRVKLSSYEATPGEDCCPEDDRYCIDCYEDVIKENKNE